MTPPHLSEENKNKTGKYLTVYTSNAHFEFKTA